MELEDELLEKGFESNGPFVVSKLSEAITHQVNKYKLNIKEIHIIRGEEARKDMEEYKGLYMIYVKTKSR
ncbi:hypothetical protein CMI40_00760 [Candidatus Pacearchaeota archaeon]|jgi:hypothetical protein|nr:hypothetical protein [Candidatus Pacearchaeota archaeon]|tara:strand:- start:2623 stop:2832 length:210 start_codon:yes stop_codon:yes gene_type:complete